MPRRRLESLFSPRRARRGLAASACGLLVLCGLLSLGQKARAVALDALIGFGSGPNAPSRYETETWTPLAVYLSGLSERGAGQLQVSVQRGKNRTIYTRPVTLQPGSPRDVNVERFVLDFHNRDNIGGYRDNSEMTTVDIQLLLDGRKLAAKTFVLYPTNRTTTYNVLALTPTGRELDFLTKKRMDLTHRHTAPSPESPVPTGPRHRGADESRPNARIQILNADPRALPDRAQGYATVDAVVLSEYPLSHLTTGQTDALKGYVRDGGLLIVTGAQVTSPTFYAEMLPIRPMGDSVVDTNDSFCAPLKARYNWPTRRDGWSLPVGVLKPGARTLLGRARESNSIYPDWNSGYGIVAARPYGSGVVVLSALPLSLLDATNPDFAATYWQDLLRCGNDALSPRDLLQGGAAHPWLALPDALAGKQAGNTPAFGVVAGLLLIYLVILLPVSYFLLKRLDRRELAWVTMPLTVGAFAVVAYGVASSIKGHTLTAHRAVVLETQANSDQAAGYAQTTLYSPRRADYNIAFGSDDPQANAAYSRFTPGETMRSETARALAPLTIEQTDTATTLRGAQVKLWDKRSFETPVAANIGQGVEATFRALPGQHALEVTLVNRTPYRLENCALVTPLCAFPLQTLPPGETRRQIIWPENFTAGGQASTSQNLGAAWEKTLPYRPDAPESSEETRALIRASMMQTLGQETQYRANYDLPGGYGKPAFAFVGWFYDPLLQVRLDGKAAPGEEANLLFAHLTLPDNAFGARQARDNPFVSPTAFITTDAPTTGMHANPGMMGANR